jgi:glycerate 2-kinase
VDGTNCYAFCISSLTVNTVSMHILVAPNAFKNSLDARRAGDAIANGIRQSGLSCSIKSLPVGDGGDGTGTLLVEHLKGDHEQLEVLDPLGRRIKSRLGWIDAHRTAVIEMADASGLRLLKPSEYNPLIASSYGTGELIRHAVLAGAGKIILCIGGSATVDGGMGILSALGVKFIDQHGIILKTPSDLVSLADIDTGNLLKEIHDVDFRILCDVSNPLVGESGAAAVFAPQKGAGAEEISILESGLRQLASLILSKKGNDISHMVHGGAAGGVAAGLHAILDAKLENGIEAFLRLVDVETEMKKTNWVITGEGSIDEQTLHGKAPFGVARKAKEYGISVLGLAGKIPEPVDKALLEYFDELICINEPGTSLEEALRNTSFNLEKTACEWAKKKRG